MHVNDPDTDLCFLRHAHRGSRDANKKAYSRSFMFVKNQNPFCQRRHG